MVQWVNDLVLSLQWLGLLLWCRFDPWSGNFHISQAWPKKKIKKNYLKTWQYFHWSWNTSEENIFRPENRLNFLNLKIHLSTLVGNLNKHHTHIPFSKFYKGGFQINMRLFKWIPNEWYTKAKFILKSWKGH